MISGDRFALGLALALPVLRLFAWYVLGKRPPPKSLVGAHKPVLILCGILALPVVILGNLWWKEDRVRKLESGDQPLEDALRLFEEGIELTRACHERLDAAERRRGELSGGKGGEGGGRGMCGAGRPVVDAWSGFALCCVYDQALRASPERPPRLGRGSCSSVGSPAASSRD